MKVLFDLNVWIDVATRPGSYPESSELYRSLIKRGDSICLPLCGYTTLFHLLNRVIGPEAAEEFLFTLQRRGVNYLRFTLAEVKLARGLNMSDHEDACIAASGLTGGVDILVTRNGKDFRNSPIKVISPKEALVEMFA